MAATNARSDARFQARRRGGVRMRQEIGHLPSKHLYGALICIVVMVVAAAGLAGCSSSESAATSTPAPTAEPTPAPTTGDTPTSTPGGGLPISSPSQFYSLTVSVSPSGSGTVTYPGSNLAAGTEAVLTAAPATGYAFDYWSGDASGTSISTTLNMESNRSVTAYFVPNTVRSMLVTPASASMETRRVQRFKAVATYSDGSTADVTNRVTWRSSNPSVATIASSGQAIGISAGSVVITATMGSARGVASLTVTAS